MSATVLGLEGGFRPFVTGLDTNRQEIEMTMAMTMETVIRSRQEIEMTMVTVMETLI